MRERYGFGTAKPDFAAKHGIGEPSARTMPLEAGPKGNWVQA